MIDRSPLLIRPSDGVHLTIKSIVREGDRVIDATMGNGHDTCFLARLVGPQGKVTAFDIQEAALKATSGRLEREGLADGRVDLHLCSHARMAEFVGEPVSAVMFNLGYLPGGDRSCITRSGETIAAMEAACALLQDGGVMTVMCYVGHEGGAEEGLAVRNYFKNLPIREWLVAEVTQLNGSVEAPFLLIAYKGS